MTLLEIAAESHRSFALIHFAGSSSCQVDIFRPGEYTLEDKLTAAEIFLGGGTSFERPIREAIHLMKPKGFEKADVVFITVGECELPDGCQQELQVSQAAYHFIAGFLLIPIGGNRLQKMAHYQLVLIGLYRCLYRTIHSSFSYTFFLCLRFFYFFGRILVSPCSHVFSADCIFTKPT